MFMDHKHDTPATCNTWMISHQPPYKNLAGTFYILFAMDIALKYMTCHCI